MGAIWYECKNKETVNCIKTIVPTMISADEIPRPRLTVDYKFYDHGEKPSI